MNYYKLLNGIHDVGCVPQSEGMTDGYRYDGSDCVWYIGDDYSIAPNLDAIQLKSRAKLTDQLSCVVINSGRAKIFSLRLLRVLKKFKLPAHQIHKAKVVKLKREVVNYFLFMITENAETIIDFEKSSFIIKKTATPEFRNIKINSFQEYETYFGRQGLLAVGEAIRSRKLFFKKEMNYDMFRFKRLFGGYVVNEKLKMALEEKEITGVDFEKIDLNDPA